MNQASLPRLAALAFRAVRPLVRSRYVVLHGYYGAGNVGDEAILAASLDQIRSVTDLEPVVFCRHPERVASDFGVRSVDPERIGRRAVVDTLLRARAYLLGGGGLLKDYGPEERRSLERGWLQWLALAQAVGAKTMLWSVGVENVRFERSKEALREVLADTDVVTVRDEGSAERLRELGITRPVHVTGDPVPWLVRTYARARSRPLNPRVVVCLRHWYPYEFRVPDEAANERMVDAVAGALDHLAEVHGAEVTFVPFRTTDRDDDREACRAVQTRMRTASTLCDEADPGVGATTQRIAEADLVIGMRLHASIMATAMGIPTIALAYMPKVRDYMTSIGQGARVIGVEEATQERLIEEAERVLDRYDEHSEALLAATAELVHRFQRNRELLAAVLNGRRSLS